MSWSITEVSRFDFLGGFIFISLCFYRKIRQMKNDIFSFLASGVVVQAPL